MLILQPDWLPVIFAVVNKSPYHTALANVSPTAFSAGAVKKNTFLDVDIVVKKQMWFIMICSSVTEQARWTKSCTVIGYPSRQDGAILPAWDYLLYRGR